MFSSCRRKKRSLCVQTTVNKRLGNRCITYTHKNKNGLSTHTLIPCYFSRLENVLLINAPLKELCRCTLRSLPSVVQVYATFLNLKKKKAPFISLLSVHLIPFPIHIEGFDLWLHALSKIRWSGKCMSLAKCVHVTHRCFIHQGVRLIYRVPSLTIFSLGNLCGNPCRQMRLGNAEVQDPD